jgi:hypothetical protein
VWSLLLVLPLLPKIAPSKRFLGAQVRCKKSRKINFFAQNLSETIESLSQRFMKLPNCFLLNVHECDEMKMKVSFAKLEIYDFANFVATITGGGEWRHLAVCEIPRVQVWGHGETASTSRRGPLFKQAQIGLGGSRFSCRVASTVLDFPAN